MRNTLYRIKEFVICNQLIKLDSFTMSSKDINEVDDDLQKGDH